MFEKIFGQPQSFIAIASLITAFGTLFLQWGLNQRTRRLDEHIKIHSANLSERNADTAAALADLKQTEVENAATNKWVDIIEHRADILQADFAELLGLLELFAGRPDHDDQQVLQKISQLARSISLSIPPRGKFGEELTIQLGHIREAVAKGPMYITERPGLLWALQTNAWRIVDAERSRVLEALSEGKVIERCDLMPEIWPSTLYPSKLPTAVNVP